MSETTSTLLAVPLMVLAVIGSATMLVMLISLVRIFQKAGIAGWKAFIPGYSIYILYSMAWEGKWFFISSILFILANAAKPFGILGVTVYALAVIAVSFIGMIFNLKLAKSFGYEGWFAAGLICLPFIFYPVMAFGPADYMGVPDPYDFHGYMI